MTRLLLSLKTLHDHLVTSLRLHYTPTDQSGQQELCITNAGGARGEGVKDISALLATSHKEFAQASD